MPISTFPDSNGCIWTGFSWAALVGREPTRSEALNAARLWLSIADAAVAPSERLAKIEAEIKNECGKPIGSLNDLSTQLYLAGVQEVASGSVRNKGEMPELLGHFTANYSLCVAEAVLGGNFTSKAWQSRHQVRCTARLSEEFLAIFGAGQGAETTIETKLIGVLFDGLFPRETGSSFVRLSIRAYAREEARVSGLSPPPLKKTKLSASVWVPPVATAEDEDWLKSAPEDRVDGDR